MQHVFYSRNHFGGSTRSIQCRSWRPRPNFTKIGAAPDNIKKRRSKLGRNRIRGDACTAMCLSTDCTGKERQALELAAMCAARASASRRSEAQRGSTGTCKARVGRFVQHAFPDLDTSSISGPPRPPRWRTRFGSTIISQLCVLADCVFMENQSKSCNNPDDLEMTPAPHDTMGRKQP